MVRKKTHPTFKLIFKLIYNGIFKKNNKCLLELSHCNFNIYFIIYTLQYNIIITHNIDATKNSS